MFQQIPDLTSTSNRLDAQSRFLSIADDIGCRLVRDAIWSDGRCNWMIWNRQLSNGMFRSLHTAASMDIYLGVAGIALFFAHLTRFTDNIHQRETLYAAVGQLEYQLTKASPKLFGFYSGSSGAAWTLAAVGEMLGERRWISTGLDALRSIAEISDTTDQFDLLSGQAGLILALVTAGEYFDNPELIESAARIGDTLIAAANRGPDTASWASNAGETRNLVGMSHGTTGIALALLELHRLYPKTEYRTTACEALNYERAAFSLEQKNWPDFRAMPGMPVQQPGFPVAWCHGSTGMGIARLRLLDLLPDDPYLLPEIDIALANATNILNAPLSSATSDMTLCHGVTGNSELLLLVGDRFGRADVKAAALQVGTVIDNLCHQLRMPWICGIPECGESPSLLVGSAGIGLHFLRLHDSKTVPSILLPSISPQQKPSVY